jgi:hypothetical protein
MNTTAKGPQTLMYDQNHCLARRHFQQHDIDAWRSVFALTWYAHGTAHAKKQCDSCDIDATKVCPAAHVCLYVVYTEYHEWMQWREGHAHAKNLDGMGQLSANFVNSVN